MRVVPPGRVDYRCAPRTAHENAPRRPPATVCTSRRRSEKGSRPGARRRRLLRVRLTGCAAGRLRPQPCSSRPRRREKIPATATRYPHEATASGVAAGCTVELRVPGGSGETTRGRCWQGFTRTITALWPPRPANRLCRAATPEVEGLRRRRPAAARRQGVRRQEIRGQLVCVGRTG